MAALTRHYVVEAGTADFMGADIGVCPRTALADERDVVVNAHLEERTWNLGGEPYCALAGSAQRWEPSRRELGSGRAPGSNRLAQVVWASREIYRRPFIWSQQHDIPINYVGHADKWDAPAIEGDIAAKDCVLRLKCNWRRLAVASIFRDLESLPK